MRQTFAHQAVLSIGPDGDLGAPGAAITLALCGSWSHTGGCPLAAHHTTASRNGDQVLVRVLFATQPDLETEARAKTTVSLENGSVTDPPRQRATLAAAFEPAQHRSPRRSQPRHPPGQQLTPLPAQPPRKHQSPRPFYRPMPASRIAPPDPPPQPGRARRRPAPARRLILQERGRRPPTRTVERAAFLPTAPNACRARHTASRPVTAKQPATGRADRPGDLAGRFSVHGPPRTLG